LISCNQKTEKIQSKNKSPNILLIVADDLGYSDISPFGGEIQTPTLNKLANEGLIFSNFHVLPTCSPTRSALLSGNDNHVAGVGVMREFIYPEIENLPGYEGHLSDRVAILPEILNKAGYNTYMAGKWHLGDKDEQSPYARGFKETFALMEGGGSHWADMRSISAVENMTYRKNGKKISELPPDFYSTKNYTDSIIHYIDHYKNDEKPFFAYLSFTAPHDPLHAPEEYIEKYKGQYNIGWDALRAQRLQGLKNSGAIDTGVNELPINGMIPQWDTLSEEMKVEFTRDMEVYAAMVDYMDMSIGRLLQYLKDNNLYNNTIIVFFSDNGPNGAPVTAYPGNEDGRYLSTFNNDTNNRGLHNSFIEMGPGWAQAAASPFRLYKSFTSEGGIRSPLIIKPTIDSKIEKGWNKSFLHVTDMMPTFLEIARAIYPIEVDGVKVKQPIGKSILPILNGEALMIHKNEGMGYELFEMKAYIMGDWKILRLPAPFGNNDWELFNIANDPGEIHDLSLQYPEKKSELLEAWHTYAIQNEVHDHKGRFDALYRKIYGVK
jgi:arylsulfatase